MDMSERSSSARISGGSAAKSTPSPEDASSSSSSSESESESESDDDSAAAPMASSPPLPPPPLLLACMASAFRPAVAPVLELELADEDESDISEISGPRRFGARTASRMDASWAPLEVAALGIGRGSKSYRGASDKPKAEAEEDTNMEEAVGAVRCANGEEAAPDDADM